MRDCHSAMKLDSDHLKAHFRLARCLYLLSWTREAFDCLQLFKDKFPDYARSHPCEALDRDIKAAIFSRTENGESRFHLAICISVFWSRVLSSTVLMNFSPHICYCTKSSFRCIYFVHYIYVHCHCIILFTGIITDAYIPV